MTPCFCIVFALLALTVTASQNTSQINQTNLQAAIADMRSNSYSGFVILLEMLSNDTLHSRRFSRNVTFLMPGDEDLSKASIHPNNLKDFLLSHSIPKSLSFTELASFPTGALVPSGLHNKMIKISNHGASNFFVNNAQIVTPNVCLRSLIKCHGISAVFENKNSINGKNLMGVAATLMPAPTTASSQAPRSP